MENKNIVIDIRGQACTGKSTIAEAITALLEDLGIKVTNSDYDVVLGCVNPDTHAERLEALKQQGLQVNITCTILNKEPRDTIPVIDYT